MLALCTVRQGSAECFVGVFSDLTPGLTHLFPHDAIFDVDWMIFDHLLIAVIQPVATREQQMSGRNQIQYVCIQVCRDISITINS